MRILVVSDIHGDTLSAMNAIQDQPTANTILFLGDGIGAIDKLTDLYPNKTFYSVAGNCDFASVEPTTRVMEFGGKRIMMTHGHEYHVKFGIENVVHSARRNQCDILLYGHTHIPETHYDKGLYVLNPGSLSRRNSNTYGIIDIISNGILCNILSL
ncbi:MAG: YfcE family phosphodiesterase [Clostridia bacterium]|nr:YfcE family phosphodiesterase [Clostridia bacterium]